MIQPALIAFLTICVCLISSYISLGKCLIGHYWYLGLGLRWRGSWTMFLASIPSRFSEWVMAACLRSAYLEGSLGSMASCASCLVSGSGIVCWDTLTAYLAGIEVS